MIHRLPSLILAGVVATAGGPAAAQVSSDDARFRLQQEIGRLDAARDNARIERERARLASPPGAGSGCSDPAADLDRWREEHRRRDETSRIEREGDRLRGEQQRLERERLFADPTGR